MNIGVLTQKGIRGFVSIVVLVLIGTSLNAEQSPSGLGYLEPDYRVWFGREHLWQLVRYDGEKTVKGMYLEFSHQPRLRLDSVDYFAVRSWENGLFGFVDRAGNWVVEPQFGHARSITNGYGTVLLDNLYYAITDEIELIGLREGITGASYYNGLFSAEVRPSTRRALTIDGEVFPYDLKIDGPSLFFPLSDNLNLLITQDGMALYDDQGSDVTKHEYSLISEPVVTGHGLLMPALIGKPNVVFYSGGEAGMGLDSDGEMVLLDSAQKVVISLGPFVLAPGVSGGFPSTERFRAAFDFRTREGRIFDLETLSFWEDGIISASMSIDGRIFCVFENDPRKIYLMDGEKSVSGTFSIPRNVSEIDTNSLNNFGFLPDFDEGRVYRILALGADTESPTENVRHFGNGNGSVESRVDDEYVLSIGQLSGSWQGLERHWDPVSGDYFTAPGTDRRIYAHLSTDASDTVAIHTDEGWSFTYRNASDEVLFDRFFEGAIPFSNQIGAILTEDGWAYIDDSGTTISEPFDFALPFSHGLAAVKTDGTWSYIDTEMNTAIPGPFDYAGPFHGEYAIVGLGTAYPWRVNADPSQFTWYEEYSSIVLNGKLGVIDRHGELILPIEYDYLRFAREANGVYIIAEKGGETFRSFLSPVQENAHRF